MNYIIYLLLCVLGGFLSSEAREGSPIKEHYDQEIQRIIKRGYLIVAMHKDSIPPFSGIDHDGKPNGLEIEIVEKIARNLGVKVQYHRLSNTFDEVVDTVARHDADLGISKISYTTERAKKVLFTKPYVTLQKALLINRVKLASFRSETNTLEELFKSKKNEIGVIESSSYENYVAQIFPQGKITPYQSWYDGAIPALLRDELMAVMRDDLEVKKIFLADPTLNLHLMAVLLKGEYDSIHIIVPSSSTFFQYWLDNFISHEIVTQTSSSLIEKYKDFFMTQLPKVQSQKNISDKREATKND